MTELRLNVSSESHIDYIEDTVRMKYDNTEDSNWNDGSLNKINSQNNLNLVSRLDSES
jgi:hypothetical protein